MWTLLSPRPSMRFRQSAASRTTDPGALDRAATRVTTPVVDDRAVRATGNEVLRQRRQLVGGQCRLHRDDGIPRPHVVDFQLGATDLNEAHARRLAPDGCSCSDLRAVRGSERASPSTRCAA